MVTYCAEMTLQGHTAVRALQLASFDAGSNRWHVFDETLAVVEALACPLSIVAFVGPRRCGKSLLANAVAGAVAPGRGFAVGHTVAGCTRGIWLLEPPVAPVSLAHGAPPGTRVLFLDAEGLGGSAASDAPDIALFSLVALLCSTLVYNSKGAIDEDSIATLGIVAHMARAVKVAGSGGCVWAPSLPRPRRAPSLQRAHTRVARPAARWRRAMVVACVWCGVRCPAMFNEFCGARARAAAAVAACPWTPLPVTSPPHSPRLCGCCGTSRWRSSTTTASRSRRRSTWSARCRTRPASTATRARGTTCGSACASTSRAGAATRSCARSWKRASCRCACVRARARVWWWGRVGVTRAGAPPQRLDALIAGDTTRPGFRDGLAALRADLLSDVKPKRVQGRPVTGPMFAALVRSYVGAMGAGAAPNVGDAWAAAVDAEAACSASTAAAGFAASVREIALPCDEGVLVAALAAARAAAIEAHRSGAPKGSPPAHEARLRAAMDAAAAAAAAANVEASRTACAAAMHRAVEAHLAPLEAAAAAPAGAATAGDDVGASPAPTTAALARAWDAWGAVVEEYGVNARGPSAPAGLAAAVRTHLRPALDAVAGACERALRRALEEARAARDAAADAAADAHADAAAARAEAARDASRAAAVAATEAAANARAGAAAAAAAASAEAAANAQSEAAVEREKAVAATAQVSALETVRGDTWGRPVRRAVVSQAAAAAAEVRATEVSGAHSTEAALSEQLHSATAAAEAAAGDFRRVSTELGVARAAVAAGVAREAELSAVSRRRVCVCACAGVRVCAWGNHACCRVVRGPA